MAKALTAFDYYGQRKVPSSALIVRVTFRTCEALLRVGSIVYFGAMLRPEDAKKHDNVAYHLPCMLILSFLATFAVVKTTSKIPEMHWLWACFFMIGAPPLFLHAF